MIIISFDFGKFIQSSEINSSLTLHCKKKKKSEKNSYQQLLMLPGNMILDITQLWYVHNQCGAFNNLQIFHQHPRPLLYIPKSLLYFNAYLKFLIIKLFENKFWTLKEDFSIKTIDLKMHYFRANIKKYKINIEIQYP